MDITSDVHCLLVKFYQIIRRHIICCMFYISPVGSSS